MNKSLPMLHVLLYLQMPDISGIITRCNPKTQVMLSNKLSICRPRSFSIFDTFEKSVSYAWMLLSPLYTFFGLNKVETTQNMREWK